MPELPDFVSATMTSVSLWKWDFPKAMKGFGALFDEANEPGPDGVGLFEDMLDGLRDDPEGVQVDLRREVFAHLGPDILSIADQLGPKTDEAPNGDRTLYITTVRDLPTVTSALQRFYQGDDRVKHEQQQGYHIWTVPAGASLFVEGESDSVVSIRALALGEGRMLFGTDEQLLRNTLSGIAPTEGLKDAPEWSSLWQGMKEQVGNRGASWSLLRLEDLLAPSYAEAIAAPPAERDREQQAGPSALSGLWRVLLFGTADDKTEVPLAAAPAFSNWQSSLPPTSAALTESESGLSAAATPRENFVGS
jgi:hypothetical protein